MVNLLTQEELRSLVEESQGEGPFASLYLPLATEPDQRDANRIRLKNLISEAESQLAEAGLAARAVDAFLKPAKDLIGYGRFWLEPANGMAIFLGKNFSRIYTLPLDFAELVVVGDQVHLKPLLQLFAGNGRFYVLALSQQEIRLLQGTRFTVEQVQLRNVPDSLTDALKWDDPERHLQWHTSTGITVETGGRAAVFHGHATAASEEERKEEILRYLRKIEAGINDLLVTERAPLVLAGVDFLIALYREVSEYPYLLADHISGNPEELSAETLHAHAWELVKPYFAQQQEAAAAQYAQLEGRDTASDALEEIVPAAHYGRIDTLFTSLGEQRWGSFDRSSGQVDLHDKSHAHDRDLLDDVAVHTFLNGGTVFAVEPDAMPTDASAAAVFRY